MRKGIFFGVLYGMVVCLALIFTACGDDTSSATISADSVKEGSFEDPRDGQTYRTVTIGSQTWMAENLNCDTQDKDSYCYAEDPDSCFKYGRLYWANLKSVCPPGWHLPTIEEFKTLFEAVGGMNSAGKMLRANDGYATDDYSFSALPAGCAVSNAGIGTRFRGSSGEVVRFKTATPAYYVTLDKDNAILDSIEDMYTCNMLPVRCVEGEDPSVEPLSCATPQPQNKHEGRVDPSTVVVDSITDSRDNRTYRTVTIGTQTWMGENLNYETAESRCYGCEKYGRIYRWDDAQTACPPGWHLPTKSEFETLVEAVGGLHVGGRMLKSTDLWTKEDDEKEGSDAYSFTALPAGLNLFEFDEGNLHSGTELHTAFWSSSEADSSLYAYSLNLAYDSRKAVFRSNPKNDGYSVRCLKD